MVKYVYVNTLTLRRIFTIVMGITLNGVILLNVTSEVLLVHIILYHCHIWSVIIRHNPISYEHGLAAFWKNYIVLVKCVDTSAYSVIFAILACVGDSLKQYNIPRGPPFLPLRLGEIFHVTWKSNISHTVLLSLPDALPNIDVIVRQEDSGQRNWLHLSFLLDG